MNDRRVDELAAAWSAEDPDPALRSELEELLRRDPAARCRFLDHCVAEMALVDALASASAVPTTRRRLHRLPGRRRSSPLLLWTAGLAAAASLAIAMLLTSTVAGPGMHVVSGELLADGHRIQAGSQIVLPLSTAQAGTVGVVIGCSAGIDITATAGTGFSIPTLGTITLESGQLTLEVDRSRAPPTVVRTPELAAAVVGTRFSVQRRDERSEVVVERGRVRVSTPHGAGRDVATGQHIAADREGLIDESLAPVPSQAQAALSLVVIDATGAESRRFPPDETVPITSGQPFTLRADTAPAVSAVRFHLDGTMVRGQRSFGLERIPPFYLWGDTHGRHTLQTLDPGTYRLEITCFADSRGTTPLGTYTIILLAK